MFRRVGRSFDEVFPRFQTVVVTVIDWVVLWVTRVALDVIVVAVAVGARGVCCLLLSFRLVFLMFLLAMLVLLVVLSAGVCVDGVCCWVVFPAPPRAHNESQHPALCSFELLF